jgi:hypothetical protein
MKLFTCCCGWSFVVRKKRVFGPMYELGSLGHFSGPNGCHHAGRMMTREEFADEYADCAAELGSLEDLIAAYLAGSAQTQADYAAH